MRTVAVPASGLAGLGALLVALAIGVGLTPLGWLVGVLCGLVPVVACGRRVRGADRETADSGRPTPADRVTLARAVLVSGVAALVADSFVRPPVVPVLVALTAVALALDAVDGWVARRTGAASGFGATFDGETDAFLILVLSLYAVPRHGLWVVALGLVRYVFWLGGRLAPWLRAPLPARYWRKVVTAVTGIALALAAADLAPNAVTVGGLGLAALLLAESFGRDVVWLWRHRHDAPGLPARAALARADRPLGRGRRFLGPAVDLVALLLVWVVLLAPTELPAVTPVVLLRIPVEALAIGALALALPTRPRRALSGAVGLLLGVVMVVKLLDMGFFAALGRPFNPLTDLGLFGPVFALTRDTVGRVAGDVVGVTAVLLVIALLVGVPLSLRRVTALVARHRRRSTGVLAALTAVWLVALGVGWQTAPGQPVAAASAVRVVSDQVRLAASTVRGERRFAAELGQDQFRDVPASRLLTGLRGKDVLVVFVESYGRVAVDGPRATATVRDVLREGNRRLADRGFHSRSAFLTSPTFGGHSWLAHSTLESGLWVTDEGRYDRLLSSDRMTLSRYFHRAGWRTVAVLPSDREPWPQGRSFYGFDRVYGGQQLGYHGPRFGFSLMPDQFALEAAQRRALAPADTPVFAQVELASSHTPWAPLPSLVPWDQLGDGSIFGPIHHRAQGVGGLWQHRDQVPEAYARSVAYSVRSVLQFVQRYGDDDLVLILLGDHQPASIVSGYDADHEVPISIIASDQRVLDRIADWHWQPGLLPDDQAPVWRMDTVRDRLLQAYTGPGDLGPRSP